MLMTRLFAEAGRMMKTTKGSTTTVYDNTLDFSSAVPHLEPLLSDLQHHFELSFSEMKAQEPRKPSCATCLSLGNQGEVPKASSWNLPSWWVARHRVLNHGSIMMLLLFHGGHRRKAARRIYHRQIDGVRMLAQRHWTEAIAAAALSEGQRQSGRRREFRSAAPPGLWPVAGASLEEPVQCAHAAPPLR